MAQAASLQTGQIRHLLRVTAATSRHPECDTLGLLLGLTAGMRVTEIAQIEVQDVLFPSGALREEISLRAAITKGCRQRCIYLSHAKAIEALDRYLDCRIAQRLRTTNDPGRYRGLEPTSKLILTHKGYKFHLNTKRRVSWAGVPVEYLACDSLTLREQLVRIALEWERRFGVVPSITSTLAEYDAAQIVGHSDDSFATDCVGRTAVSRGFDFTYMGKRYQIKACRLSGKPGSTITKVHRAANYDWDLLIWVLYDRRYQVLEAWQWDVDAYRASFDSVQRLSPAMMRAGHPLHLTKYGSDHFVAT